MTAQEMVRRSVADDSYGRASLTWSIEFREVHTLPRAEDELAVVYRKRHIVTHKDRFDVRRRVSLRMAVIAVFRNDLRKVMKQITLHIRVSVLIDEDRGRRVRDIYDAYTFAHLRPRDRCAYAGCHVDGHLALLGADRQLFVVGTHARVIRS